MKTIKKILYYFISAVFAFWLLYSALYLYLDGWHWKPVSPIEQTLDSFVSRCFYYTMLALFFINGVLLDRAEDSVKKYSKLSNVLTKKLEVYFEATIEHQDCMTRQSNMIEKLRGWLTESKVQVNALQHHEQAFKIQKELAASWFNKYMEIKGMSEHRKFIIDMMDSQSAVQNTQLKHLNQDLLVANGYAAKLEKEIEFNRGVIDRLTSENIELHPEEITCSLPDFRDFLKTEDSISNSFTPNKIMTIDIIKEAVSKTTGVTIEDMVSQKRFRPFVEARQIAMHLCRIYLPEISLSQVGKAFGDRDHSTVMYADNSIKNLSSVDKSIAKTITGIRLLLS